jgi:N-acetyltransferase
MIAAPVTLEGRNVWLEPLAMDHAAHLVSLAEPEIFRFFAGPVPGAQSLESLEAYVRDRIEPNTSIPLAIVWRETEQAVGTTSFLDIRPDDRGLEIGSTWIGRPFQGTAVNPESKYLMLRHAFEDLEAIRVQLKCDLRNKQSQRAIEKLGAKREGVLRRQKVLEDGYIRDTVMYSITDEDWPAVRDVLERRLAL